MDIERTNELTEVFNQTMKRAYECMGKDGFRIPASEGKSKRPISMTLYETLFYYYTMFQADVPLSEIKRGVDELLEDEDYLMSLQHSVDSSVNVRKRFEKVMEKYKEIVC
jgi:hypothetical protein